MHVGDRAMGDRSVLPEGLWLSTCGWGNKVLVK